MIQKLCESCANDCKFMYFPVQTHELKSCGMYKEKQIKKQTNADRSRAMGDDELADLLWETVDGAYYQIENFMAQPSKGWWLEWLKSEVDE